MKADTYSQLVRYSGHIETPGTRFGSMLGHGFWAYLLSIGDVAIALMVLISGCGISLLMLYSAFGAF